VKIKDETGKLETCQVLYIGAKPDRFKNEDLL